MVVTRQCGKAFVPHELRMAKLVGTPGAQGVGAAAGGAVAVG